MQITNYTFANITVRPFLTLNDANNPWILTETTKHIIDVCMYREPELQELFRAKGITFDWFPTDEQPMDLDMVLKRSLNSPNMIAMAHTLSCIV